jgi:DNA topoisomerase IB
VCRRSYVHPAVVEAFQEGGLPRALDGPRRGGTALSRAEQAVLALLRTAPPGVRPNASN